MAKAFEKIEQLMRKAKKSGFVRGWDRNCFRSNKCPASGSTNGVSFSTATCTNVPMGSALPTAGTRCSMSTSPTSETSAMSRPSLSITAFHMSDKQPRDEAGDLPLMQDKHGNSIVLGDEFPSQLADLVIQNRAVKAAESRTEKLLWRMTDDHDCLSRHVDSKQEEIESIRANGADEDLKALPDKECRLGALQRERTRVDNLRKSTDRALEAKWREQRIKFQRLISMVDELFVDNKIVPAPSVDEANSRSISDIYERLDIWKFSEDAEKEVDDAGQDKEDTGAEALKAHYYSMRTKLHGTEDNLYKYCVDNFQAYIDERERKTANGEPVETQTDFDHRWLKWKQDLTRDLINAENDLEEAQKEAIEGGVQLSDAESRFLDQPDDGYRDEDLMVLIDSGAVQAWVDQLPEPDISQLDVTQVAYEPDGGPDEEEWEAISVGISESPSMVAEDPWRRRIDDWKDVCGVDK